MCIKPSIFNGMEWNRMISRDVLGIKYRTETCISLLAYHPSNVSSVHALALAIMQHQCLAIASYIYSDIHSYTVAVANHLQQVDLFPPLHR